MPDAAPVASARRIVVEPTRVLVDERISVRLDGFEPGQTVTLRARMNDDQARAWESSATFAADADGSVDVGAQRPLAGSYDSADSMGLIWSMRPVGDAEGARGFVKTSLAPTVVTLTAEAGDQTVATAEVERLWSAPDVTRTEVRDHGM